MKKKVFLRLIPWTCSALPTRICRRISENRWKVSSTPMAGVTKESEVFPWRNSQLWKRSIWR